MKLTCEYLLNWATGFFFFEKEEIKEREGERKEGREKERKEGKSEKM